MRCSNPLQNITSIDDLSKKPDVHSNQALFSPLSAMNPSIISKNSDDIKMTFPIFNPQPSLKDTKTSPFALRKVKKTESSKEFDFLFGHVLQNVKNLELLKNGNKIVIGAEKNKKEASIACSALSEKDFSKGSRSMDLEYLTPIQKSKSRNVYLTTMPYASKKKKQMRKSLMWLNCSSNHAFYLKKNIKMDMLLNKKIKISFYLNKNPRKEFFQKKKLDDRFSLSCREKHSKENKTSLRKIMSEQFNFKTFSSDRKLGWQKFKNFKLPISSIFDENDSNDLKKNCFYEQAQESFPSIDINTFFNLKNDNKIEKICNSRVLNPNVINYANFDSEDFFENIKIKNNICLVSEKAGTQPKKSDLKDLEFSSF